MHDVDEDMATIPIYGGFWHFGSKAGIARRSIMDSLNTTSDTVAFGQKLNIHSSL